GFQFLGVRYAVPAPIVAPMSVPQFVVRTRDRISEDLELIGGEEGEIWKHGSAGFRREIGLIRCAAPEVITGVDQPYLPRDLTANAGTKPVTGDEQVGALIAAVGEMNKNAISILFDPLEHVPEVITLPVDRL